MTSRVTLRRAIAGAAMTALAAGGTLIGVSAANAAPPHHETATHATATHATTTDSGSASAATPAPGTQTANPPDPALSGRVATWVSQGGEKQLTTLGTDFRSLEQAAESADLGSMRTNCVQLGKDVAGAQAYAPIPDASAQREWSAALAAYATGAKDCVAGATTSNVNMISTAADEMIAGSNHLDNVTQRLTEIAGR
ncbi:MAG TPA: hypothetical protein VFR11_02725 [Micromonosporaceae bacterium]|nr:hypothetical protein [Micromonosporaceae bacterium]